MCYLVGIDLVNVLLCGCTKFLLVYCYNDHIYPNPCL
jgi:hypothetical protein